MMKKTKIRTKRLKAGIGQAELARRAGISRQYLGLIENGSSIPTVIMAQRIADELGCAVADLWPVPEPEAA